MVPKGAEASGEDTHCGCGISGVWAVLVLPASPPPPQPQGNQLGQMQNQTSKLSLPVVSSQSDCRVSPFSGAVPLCLNN